MINIINDLSPFFEDCYRRINIREYARIKTISAPTASKLLSQYGEEGLLKKESFRNYIFFYANRENRSFVKLSHIYWEERLRPLVEEIERKMIEATIILFGSTAKGELKADSDIDICIIGEKISIDIQKYKKTYKREVQIFYFDSIKEIKSKELKINILNGVVLGGRIKGE